MTSVNELGPGQIHRLVRIGVWRLHYGYGLMLAIIGGPAGRFRPFVDLYHRSLDSFGRDRLPVAP